MYYRRYLYFLILKSSQLRNHDMINYSIKNVPIEIKEIIGSQMSIRTISSCSPLLIRMLIMPYLKFFFKKMSVLYFFDQIDYYFLNQKQQNDVPCLAFCTLLFGRISVCCISPRLRLDLLFRLVIHESCHAIRIKTLGLKTTMEYLKYFGLEKNIVIEEAIAISAEHLANPFLSYRQASGGYWNSYLKPNTKVNVSKKDVLALINDQVVFTEIASKNYINDKNFIYYLAFRIVLKLGIRSWNDLKNVVFQTNIIYK